MRRYFVTDIHGAALALEQVLERSGFNYDEDLLIVGGDMVDGWPETLEVIEILIDIPNLALVRGNHDTLFINHTRMNRKEFYDWLNIGGKATLESYANNKDLMLKHMNWIYDMSEPYIWIGNKFFVHGGGSGELPIEEQSSYSLIWGRGIISTALKGVLPGYEEVFIGHTTTTSELSPQYSSYPIRINNLWMCDTAAGFDGSLSMIDIDTKEVWQSDIVMELYPNHPGRNGFTLT